MGSSGIRRRKGRRPLSRLKGDGHRVVEPPVMWSPAGSGFEAEACSPAGTAERTWLFTGSGSDRDEEEARRRQRPVGPVGALVLRLLGERRRSGR